MRILTKDRAFALVMLVVAAVMLVEARDIRPPTRWQPYGSAFFPQLLLGVLGLLAAMLLIRSFLRPASSDRALLPAAGSFVRKNPHVIAMFATFGAYVVLLPLIGYLAATAGFLAASFVILRGFNSFRAAVANVALIVTVPLLVLLVFENVLSIRLP
jgi:putative tricarboxylic transport membrane protein